MQLTTRGRLVLGALIGCLLAFPIDAIAGGRPVQMPYSVTSQAGPQVPERLRTNCSGVLGDWSGYAHGNFGDLTDVDGDPQADVVVVGDSTLTGVTGELAAWLAARGKTLAGNYWSGRPTAPAVDWAKSLTTKPRILVVLAGTNDIFNPAVMAGEVADLQAWADLEPKTRLIWVRVQAARPATALCDQRNSMWVNAQISAHARETCGWPDGFAQDPNRIGNYLKPDGIHVIEGVGSNYQAAVIGNCIY